MEHVTSCRISVRSDLNAVASCDEWLAYAITKTSYITLTSGSSLVADRGRPIAGGPSRLVVLLATRVPIFGIAVVFMFGDAVAGAIAFRNQTR
jgi:hypothetical protein